MQKEDKIQELQLKGYGYRKIASMLDLPLNTVKSYISRHPQRRCLQCGATLTNTDSRKTKKFCSEKCRFAWWNSHPEERERKAYYHFTCHNCGKEFDYYGNAHMKFCSRACYFEARKRGGVGNG